MSLQPRFPMVVEIFGTSIGPRLSMVSPTDPLETYTLNSGLCRRVKIDPSNGNTRAEPEYYTIYNATGSSLNDGDIVIAIPVEQTDGTLTLITAT